MRYTSCGNFGNTFPHYARAENYEAIRNNLHKLVLQYEDLRNGLKMENNVTLINASNIFEYISLLDFQTFGKDLYRECPGLKRIVYWNFVVDRVLSEQLPDMFEYQEKTSKTLFDRNKIIFYNRLIVENRKTVITNTRWKT